MTIFFAVVFLVVGISSTIQSFREANTRYELVKSGRSEDDAKKYLRRCRLLGIVCICIAIYLFVIA
ncbi:hypothetical protein GCM10009038_24180 [Salinicola rhizosphaerae]|uniref:HIG1 domain-containing protein n=1 Tax=Salinicola rhizosphaerae TaxID=1443141 RepID=A0ABQ3E2J7_9GAMM|nr:hypothetical protein GCM10009038_24180 [Salinicola rhizosphaerae]